MAQEHGDIGMAMKMYTEGMQAQFGAMMEKFRASMQHSVGLSHTMNEMMEHLLTQSLSITCNVVSGSPVVIELGIGNTGKINIPVVSSTIAIYRRGTSGNGSAPVIELKTTPNDIDVEMTSSEIIPLHLPSFDQYDGIITIFCVSPGTGKRLQKVYDFSIYYLQQMNIHPISETLNEPESSFKTNALELQKLREVLRLSPVDGMLLSSHGHYALYLPSTQSSSILLVLKLIEDSTLCNVYVHVGSTSDTKSHWLDPASIVLELNALAS